MVIIVGPIVGGWWGLVTVGGVWCWALITVGAVHVGCSSPLVGSGAGPLVSLARGWCWALVAIGAI